MTAYTLTIQKPCRACHQSCRSPAAPQCEGVSACGRYWPLASNLADKKLTDGGEIQFKFNNQQYYIDNSLIIGYEGKMLM